MLNLKYAMAFDDEPNMNASAHGRPCRPTPTKGSRYLKRPRRSLRQACKDITREHGIAAIHCAACRMRNLCAASKPDAATLDRPRPNPKPAVR